MDQLFRKWICHDILGACTPSGASRGIVAASFALSAAVVVRRRSFRIVMIWAATSVGRRDCLRPRVAATTCRVFLATLSSLSRRLFLLLNQLLGLQLFFVLSHLVIGLKSFVLVHTINNLFGPFKRFILVIFDAILRAPSELRGKTPVEALFLAF